MAMNVNDAKKHFFKLLEQASHDEDGFIAPSGVPVAVLVGIDRYKPKRELGFATGAFSMPSLEKFNAPLDPETLALFIGEHEA